MVGTFKEVGRNHELKQEATTAAAVDQQEVRNSATQEVGNSTAREEELGNFAATKASASALAAGTVVASNDQQLALDHSKTIIPMEQ